MVYHSENPRACYISRFTRFRHTRWFAGTQPPRITRVTCIAHHSNAGQAVVSPLPAPGFIASTNSASIRLNYPVTRNTTGQGLRWISFVMQDNCRISSFKLIFAVFFKEFLLAAVNVGITRPDTRSIAGIPSRFHREKQSIWRKYWFVHVIDSSSRIPGNYRLGLMFRFQKGEAETDTLCLKVNFRQCEVLTLPVHTCPGMQSFRALNVSTFIRYH
jgi:hypothetical protein